MQSQALNSGRLLYSRLRGDSFRSQLLRGGAGSIAIKIANAGLAFALAVLLARILGPNDYGVYSFALAILMVTAIPAQVGIPQLVVRETAKAQASEDWGLMRGLWRWANVAVFVFSTLAVLAVGTVVATYGTTGTERLATITIGIALIPLIALARVRAASLRGLRLVIRGQLPESVFRPAILLLLLLIWIGLAGTENSVGPEVVMALYVVAAVIAFSAGAAMLRGARPDGIKEKPRPRYQFSTWRRAVGPLALITGLELINKNTDLIILGFFRPDEEVGIYRAVVQVALLVIFGLQAMNQILQPHFARLYKQRDHQKLQRLVTASARAITGLALPAALVLIVFGSTLLGSVFGAAFSAGGTALAILAVGQFANATMGSVGMLLNMTGHERDTMWAITTAAVGNIVLNIALIPSFGIEGAASASALTLILGNFLMRRSVQKRLGLETLASGPLLHAR